MEIDLGRPSESVLGENVERPAAFALALVPETGVGLAVELDALAHVGDALAGGAADALEGELLDRTVPVEEVLSLLEGLAAQGEEVGVGLGLYRVLGHGVVAGTESKESDDDGGVLHVGGSGYITTVEQSRA